MAGLDVLKTRRIDLEPLFSKASARRTTPPEGPAHGTTATVAFDYRVLFDNAYDAVLATDETGRVLASNRRAQTFFGDAPEEMSGLGLVDLIPGVTPDLIQSIVATVANRRFTVLQAWCQRADNSMFPAEVVVTGSLHDGQCTLFVQIRDATVRRASEERLLSITRAFNTAAVGLGTADLAGTITYANPYLAEKLHAPSADALAGKLLADALGNREICDAMLSAIRENQVWSDEVSLVIDSGVLWLQIDAAPHQDSEGILTGMVFCMRDIGDRKRAEAAEYQVSRNRMMMESMSTACHLLGQPATVLLSCLEIIRARQSPDPEADQSLYHMVHEAAEEMRGILQKMHAQTVAPGGEASITKTTE